MKAQKLRQQLWIDETLQKIDYIFSLVGMKWKREAEITMKLNFLYFFNIITYSGDCLGAIWWFIDGINLGKDLKELTYVVPCATLGCLGTIKSICVVISKKQVILLLDILRRFEERTSASLEENPEMKDVVENERRSLHKIYRVLNWIYLVLFAGYFISPGLQTALKYFLSNEIDLRLPLYIKYPFDSYNIKYWPFVYLHHTWLVVLVIGYICCSDYVLYAACAYICINLRLLYYDIEKCITSDHNGRNFQDSMRLEKTLFGFIRRHQEMIRCVNLLEEIYAKSTLCNFVSSSIVICFTGFNVTAERDIAFTITFVSFLLMSIFQIFFICFYGNMITETSVALGDAVFNSKWYITNARIGKILLMMKLRAQKPCKLTAYGFAAVNLQAFTKILSTSWSYFTLLQTMDSRA